MSAEVKVLPIVEGSIVWLHDIEFLLPDTPGRSMLDDAIEAMRRAVGHDQFVILCTAGDGIVEVLGPDELVDRVRSALEPVPLTGVPDPVETCSSTGMLAVGQTDDEDYSLSCVLPAGHVDALHLDPSGVLWHADGRRLFPKDQP